MKKILLALLFAAACSGELAPLTSENAQKAFHNHKQLLVDFEGVLQKELTPVSQLDIYKSCASSQSASALSDCEADPQKLSAAFEEVQKTLNTKIKDFIKERGLSGVVLVVRPAEAKLQTMAKAVVNENPLGSLEGGGGATIEPYHLSYGSYVMADKSLKPGIVVQWEFEKNGYKALAMVGYFFTEKK